MHKLCHDGLKSHSTRRRRRSGGGRSGRSWRSYCLDLCSPRAKLGLTLSNGSGVNGTYNGEVIEHGIGDRKMANDPHDSRRKNELITARHITIDIYKG